MRLTANAHSSSLTCWAKGSCAAVGDYEASTTSELAWIDLESNGIWGVARLIPLTTADQWLDPSSVACASPTSCVVTLDVAATVADGQQYNTTPAVTAEDKGAWGPLSPVVIRNTTYPVVTPYRASAVCAGGACRVLAEAAVAKATTGGPNGEEVAVANVSGNKLSAFSPLDVAASAQGFNGNLFPQTLDCATTAKCIEINTMSTDTGAGSTTSSVVHRLAAGKWTTVAKLIGPVRKVGNGGGSFTTSLNEVTSASCAASGACELVGSVSEVKGPITIAYATSLIGSTFSKRVTLAGYATSASSYNQPLVLRCFGASCVVIGQSASRASESVVASSLTGSRTGAIAKTPLPGESFITNVACVGARSCMLALDDYGATGVSIDEMTLQGSTLFAPKPLPGAAAHANLVIGPAAANGGTFVLLVDEGSTSTQPVILQTL